MCSNMYVQRFPCLRTAVARKSPWPKPMTAAGAFLCRGHIKHHHGYICRLQSTLFSWGAFSFSGQRLPTTMVRSHASSSSSSVSPPPAEIEATCLRCVVSGISGDLAEELGDVLLAMGAQSVVVQEHRPPGAPEQEIFDDGAGRLWDLCDLLAHFPLEADVDGTLVVALDSLGLGPQQGAGGQQQQQQQHQEGGEEGPLLLVTPGGGGNGGGSIQYQVEAVANEAWVEQIKASYVPLQICEDLWVVPEWSEPVDPSATNIILQPGVAFGTGEHPTTRLCLRELRRLGAEGQLRCAAVCDYGCGSGVLALAALKFGAKNAVGTDIDSLAVKAAQRNGVLNGFQPPVFTALQVGGGIEEPEPLLAELGREAEAVEAGAEEAAKTTMNSAQRVKDGSPSSPSPSSPSPSSPSPSSPSSCSCPPPSSSLPPPPPLPPPPKTAPRQFDLVVANILRGPLVELQPRLAGYVRPGGRLLLSGILYEQAPEIQMAYSGEFEDFVVATDQQWAMIRATKKMMVEEKETGARS